LPLPFALVRTAFADVSPMPMLADLNAINMPRLLACQAAAGTGLWHLSQLFVGTPGTVGARTTCHHDHHDNLYLQIAGRKRFVIYPPSESGCLYPFPVQ
jgi:hypothetical protein